MYCKQLNSFVIATAALAVMNLTGCNDAATPRSPTVKPTSAVEIPLRGLNDTGAAKFLDGTKQPNAVASSKATAPPPALTPTPVSAFPGQDATFGRDAENRPSSILNGTKGFSFVALDAQSGAELTAGIDAKGRDIFTNSSGIAVTPGCVKDRVTGLAWEYKNDIDGSIHFKDHTFTWYNPDPNTNGGNSGQKGKETTCTGMSAGSHDGIAGDTYTFIQDNNKAALCGFKDWRLPLVNELVSIYDYGATSMEEMTDKRYFGNLHGFAYHRWAAETLANHDPKDPPGLSAWAFHMHNGQPEAHSKSCDVTFNAKGESQQPGFFNGAMLVRSDP